MGGVQFTSTYSAVLTEHTIPCTLSANDSHTSSGFLRTSAKINELYDHRYRRKKRAVLGCGILPKCGGVHGSKPSRVPADITDAFNGFIQSIQCARIVQCQYSNSLRAGKSRDRIPVGVRFSAPIQTGPGAHPASYTTCTGSFPGVKRPGRSADHPPYLAPRLKKE